MNFRRSIIVICFLSCSVFLNTGYPAESWLHLSITADCASLHLRLNDALCLGNDGSARRVSLAKGQLSLAEVRDYAPLQFTGQVGEVSLNAGGNIVAAWLSEATKRYRHGVFGQEFEALRINAMLTGGKSVYLSLEGEAVFEDRKVRIVDLDADGNNELLVVKARPRQGASLALYGWKNGVFRSIASSSPIGMSNRWLNPVGSGDFDGDGEDEIAIVETPHLGALLVLYRWQQDRLLETHRISGFSNHRFGDLEQGLSAVIDIDNDGIDELVVPDAGIRELRIVGVKNKQLHIIEQIPLTAPLSALRVSDLNADGRYELLYNTEDELLHVVVFRPGAE